MSLKRALALLLLTAGLIPVAGCWDSLDVNGKTLVVTVIADKQGDEVAFYIETPNLGKGLSQNLQSSDFGQAYYTIHAKGATFAEARRFLNSKTDNPIFLGTVKALVLTNQLAENGIEEYMFRMQSDIQYRKSLTVITSYSDPEEILATVPPNNVSVGESISDSILSLKSLGKIEVFSASEILEFIHSDASFIMLNMDVDDGLLTYNGLTVFKDNKLIGFIPIEETKGITWIIGNRIHRVYVVDMDGFHVTAEVCLISRTITPDYENGSLTFDLKYKFSSLVMYLSEDIDLNPKITEQINQKLQTLLAEDIAEAIRHSKTMECDYLQFRECFRIKYPTELKSEDWLDLYMKAQFNISVLSEMRFSSMMNFEGANKNEEV